MNIKRFGVSLEEEVLNALDRYAAGNQFPNRSQAIRHLVRSNVVSEKIDANNPVAGAVVLVYDHHKRDINNKLTEVQHDFHHLILSTLHVHLSHDLCLETIALKGPARELASLADKIIGLKGIRHGRLVMTDFD